MSSTNSRPRRNKPPTILDRALEVLKRTPWRSATEVANEIGANKESVSGILCRLAKRGHLIRREGYGPRKGWGYALPEAVGTGRGDEGQVYTFKTRWERLLED